MKYIILFIIIINCCLLCVTAKPTINYHDKIIQEEDPCNQWPNCTDCISHKFCGWCSSKVIYQDGSPGYQCAGFNPNNQTNPFICVGTYSTDKCAIGYNCSSETKQCVLTDPGDGIPLDQCNATCFPKTYSCSPVNSTCVPTDASHGGIPLDVCTTQCRAQNNTPTDLIGVWRGLEISGGFIRGEWRLDFGTANASLYGPNGALVWKGNVAQVETYIVITITTGADAGLKIYALYQTEIGPVTKWATIAASRPGANPPSSFDDGMTSPTAQAFVIESCLDSSICNFGTASKMINAPPVDHCSVYANCTTCLDAPYCGWCSTKVIYQGNIIGENCAGFNPNTTDNPFVCVGTYSTIKCPLPPPVYACNSSSSQCYEYKTGESGLICNATCGKNSSNIYYKCNVAEMICEPNPNGQDSATCNSTCQLQPFPVALTGVWRGIEVSHGYIVGEWRLVISSLDNYNSYFNLTDPRNITLSGTLQHVASEAVLRVSITSPVPANKYSLYELAYGPETNYLTLANSNSDAETYPSFIEAMTGVGMNELTLIKCLNPLNCKF